MIFYIRYKSDKISKLVGISENSIGKSSNLRNLIAIKCEKICKILMKLNI